MIKKQILTGCLALCLSVGATAQDKFTDHLKQKKSGQGTVTVHQDKEIDDLVNGTPVAAKTPPAKSGSEAEPTQGSSKTPVETVQPEEGDAGAAKVSKARARANGYRIQVYSGGNSRTARQEAMRVGNQVKTYFGDLPVYTHFYSPRWICRVGDFKTYEEANEMLRQLQVTKKFSEAVIVKSKIVMEY